MHALPTRGSVALLLHMASRAVLWACLSHDPNCNGYRACLPTTDRLPRPLGRLGRCAVKEREGYRHAKEVLVNRSIRVDTETDEAIRQICEERGGQSWATVAREILTRGLIAHGFRAQLLASGMVKEGTS